MKLRTVQDWLNEYGESHENPVNKAIHWICVPVIALTLIGLLWSLPVPEAFASISPAMNWGSLFMMASVVYYFILSPSLAIGMGVILSTGRCRGTVPAPRHPPPADPRPPSRRVRTHRRTRRLVVVRTLSPPSTTDGQLTSGPEAPRG